MGRAARCVAVVLLWSLCVVSTAMAETPFERPADAVRELTGERTSVSRTWELSSGEHVTQIASSPVQWQDAQGDWHEIDLSLHPDVSGWSAQAGPMAIDLPGSAEGAVRVESGGDALTMRLLGAAAPGSNDDGAALYRNALDGVDVRLAPIAQGLKEDVVLRDHGSSRDLRYRLTVGSDDLSVRESDGGGLLVVRGEKTVFRIPAPTATDAFGATSSDGRFEAHQVDDRTWDVSTQLDQKWLDDSDRAWPVTVDPTALNPPNTFNAAATDDCTAVVHTDTSMPGDGQPNMACNTGPDRWVGSQQTGLTQFDTGTMLMHFNTLTLVQTDAIDSATLKLYRLSSNTPTTNVGVHRITMGWSPTSPPWSTGGVTQIDQSPAGTIAPGAIGQVSVDVSGLVSEWQRYTQSSGASGMHNDGILLQHEDPSGGESPGCGHTYCDQTTFGSTQNTDSAKQPVLVVKSFPAAPAGSVILTPTDGQLTSRYVNLQAKALATSVSSVYYQFATGSHPTWTDVPAWALQTPTRGSMGNQSTIAIPVSGPTGSHVSDPVVWDLSKTPYATTDGPIHVRAWLVSTVAGDGGMTPEVGYRLDRRGVDRNASAGIGPGSLDLVSGEFSLSDSDVTFEAFLQNLSLTRTYQSRGVPTRDNDMFGPGWQSNVATDEGDLPYQNLYNYSELRGQVMDRDASNPSAWSWEQFDGGDTTIAQDTSNNYVVVDDSDGTKLTFIATINGSGQITGYTPDGDHPGYTLSRASTGTSGIYEFTLTDPDGGIAKFQSEATDSPNYRLTSFAQPSSPTAMSYTYVPSGQRQQLSKVTAPNPTGGVARSLVFVWGNVGTPAVPRVTSVQVQNGTATPVTVATYSYDTNARLTQVTDPRIAGSVRNNVYHYNGNGLLDQITPSGEATWNLTYTQITGDAGWRLSTVSRAHPDGGTATNTVLYNVPLEGAVRAV